MSRKSKPEVIEDKDLDEASGGLPAVQKTRESELTSSSTTEPEAGSSHTGVVQFTMGDGSVR